MKEYIEREKASQILQIEAANHYPTLYHVGLLAAARAIDAFPAADVRPVVRGRWKLNKDGSGVCSVCGRTQLNCWDDDNRDNYCHHCGADMREES